MALTIENVPMTREALTRGRKYGPARMIILHATAGTWPGDYEWLRQGGAVNNPVSTHYLISPDGRRVVQFVSDYDTAWHAGQSTWVVDGEMRSGLNDWSIGIELSNLNRPSTPHSDAQLTAAAELCRILVARFNIPIDQLVRHVDVSPGRKTDPVALPWPNFRDLVFNRTYLPTAPIVGKPLGDFRQAIGYLDSRAHPTYRGIGVQEIVTAYRRIGEIGQVDWFLALAQMVHETGGLTSWWSLRPRRNPAGIGVTGETSNNPPGRSPGPDWAWDDTAAIWKKGVSFPSWDPNAVVAHIGRLLAYALPVGEGTVQQQSLIDTALRIRPLPDHLRGSCTAIMDLNGKWAVPGRTYGQAVAAIAERMRQW
jgi:hypothetical protein